MHRGVSFVVVSFALGAALIPAPALAASVRPADDPPSPPLILQQPDEVADSVPYGMPSVRAIASGSPWPTVQWQRSTDGVSWADVPGQTSTSLELRMTDGDDGVRFRAVFTNPSGSATSSAETVRVHQPAMWDRTKEMSAGFYVGIPYDDYASFTGEPPLVVTTTGEFPPGITFNTTTRELSGTPTQVGTWNAEIRATNRWDYAYTTGPWIVLPFSAAPPWLRAAAAAHGSGASGAGAANAQAGSEQPSRSTAAGSSAPVPAQASGAPATSPSTAAVSAEPAPSPVPGWLRSAATTPSAQPVRPARAETDALGHLSATAAVSGTAGWAALGVCGVLLLGCGVILLRRRFGRWTR